MSTTKERKQIVAERRARKAAAQLTRAQRGHQLHVVRVLRVYSYRNGQPVVEFRDAQGAFRAMLQPQLLGQLGVAARRQASALIEAAARAAGALCP